VDWVVSLTGGIVVLFFLLVSGLWIPFAIGLCGLMLLYAQVGLNGFKALGLVTWGGLNSFTLTAVPLFILMAEVILRSGISLRFYRGLTFFVSRLPGGLLQTNIIGCSLFAAISGSSVATAASIGKVAMQHLDDYRYQPALSCGSLAAGGTLGILIPPSIVMIIYGELTSTSIARLFMAGLLPGLVLAGLFALYIGVRALLSPEGAPKHAAERTPGDLWRALVDVAPIALLIVCVLGGIYAGITTPTEAAGTGAVMAVVICAIWGNLTFAALREALTHAVQVTATILFIVLAAYIFSYAAEITGIGRGISSFILDLDLGRWGFLITIVVLFALLGCLMDTIAMMMLVLPLLVPVLATYQIDLIWFGVIVTILLELGQITPPFGINLFVIQSISGRPLSTVVAGAAPFYVLMIAFVFLLFLVPELVTWLPSTMRN